MFTNDEDDVEKEDEYDYRDSYYNESDKDGNDDCDNENVDDGHEDINDDGVEYVIRPLRCFSISEDSKRALPSKGMGKLSLGRRRRRIGKSKSTPGLTSQATSEEKNSSLKPILKQKPTSEPAR